MDHLWTAIIAGGEGTRLFPISHVGCPKQFCRLNAKNTFIQEVVENFASLGIKRTQIVVITTNENQTKLAHKQTLSRGVLSQNILQISPSLGYAGAMVKASEFIYDLDPEAVIINTPSDQYLMADDDFRATIRKAVYEARNGSAVVIGVKVNDLVTAMGCGHAIYEEDGGECFPITTFVEKPGKQKANEIMRAGNSACNTGINVWAAKTLLRPKPLSLKKGQGTDDLMRKLQERTTLMVAVGRFDWHDCGTFKSLYEVSKKTPNHKNATLGEGNFDRNDCRRSLLYAADGMELRVNGASDDAVILTTINEKPIVVVAKLEESQKIKALAEDFAQHEGLFSEDFSFGARNNIVLQSNVSNELIVGFVGVENYAVYAHRRQDGMIEAVVSQQLKSH